MSNPNIWKFAHLGGKARAKKLSKKRQSEIGRKAGIVSQAMAKLRKSKHVVDKESKGDKHVA